MAPKKAPEAAAAKPKAAKAPAKAAAAPATAAAAPAKAKAAAAPKEPAAPKAPAAKTAAAPKVAAAKTAAAPAAPAAKAPAAKAAAVPAKAGAAAGKAEAKGKAKAKAKAFEPPPREEPPVEEEQKKKKNRRGGAKKKAENGEALDTNAVVTPQASAAAQKAADDAADKDPDFIKLKQKLAAVESPIQKGGATQALKKEIDALSDEIDSTIAAKKAKTPKAVGPSAMLALSLQELEEAEGEDFDVEMIQDVRKQLDNAKTAEVFNALKVKLTVLKGRCETAIKALGNAPKAASSGEKGSGKGEAREAEQEAQREAAAMRRLATLHSEQSEAIPASSVFKKIHTLEPEAMKYLFTSPYFFHQRFERNFQVVIDGINRPPKGAGRGVLPKDLVITGIGSVQVEKCRAALDKMELHSETKEVDIGYSLTKELEQDLGVFVVKTGARDSKESTVYGSKENIAKAFALAASPKAIKPALTLKMTIDTNKVKAMLPLLNGWRISTNATIKVDAPETGNAKITIGGKEQEEIDAAKQKVQDFDKNTQCKVIECDAARVQTQNKQEYRQATEAHKDVSVGRVDNGLLLIGPAAELSKLQEKLKALVQKAATATVKHAVAADQIRIFGYDTLQQISKQSGADVRRSRETGDNSLVITGDDASVANAREQIAEVLTKEGTTEHVTISEDVMKALLINSGAKIRETERKMKVSMSLDKKELKAMMMGSPSAVEAAKEELIKLQEQIDKEIAETKTLEMEVDYSMLRYIIGPKGAVLKNIRSTCGVQVNINDGEEKSTVEIKGKEEDVQKAELMIKEIVSEAGKAPAKAAPKPKPKAKVWEPKVKSEDASPAKVDGFKESTSDFPTLGGGEANGKPKAAAGAWGKKAEQKEAAKPVNGTSKESFPALGAATNGNAKAPPAEAEEETGGDVDDPFAMMGGMGAEEVYKETLVIEATAGATDIPDVEEEEEEEEEEKITAKAAFVEDEEEDQENEAGDADDPFAMMGGMGAEEVYKETLTIEGTAGATDIPDVEEEEEEEEEDEVKITGKIPGFEEDEEEDEDEDEAEEAGGEDADDPFAMMGGMGAEEVYKETLVIEATAGATDIPDVEEEEAEEEEEKITAKAAFVEDEEEEEEKVEEEAPKKKSWADMARS